MFAGVSKMFYMTLQRKTAALVLCCPHGPPGPTVPNSTQKEATGVMYHFRSTCTSLSIICLQKRLKRSDWLIEEYHRGSCKSSCYKNNTQCICTCQRVHYSLCQPFDKYVNNPLQPKVMNICTHILFKDSANKLLMDRIKHFEEH